MKAQDKQKLREWDEYRKALLTDTALEYNKSKADIEKHRLELERNPSAWMKYFFPMYATSEFAPFHLRFIKRIINNPEWWEVVSWSRELAKDTVAMMSMFYLNLTGKKKFTLFVSSSYDAACDLLKPYMLNYEANQRIIAYYGEQKLYGAWESGDFTTKTGVRYVALGAGQSPRGKKNENLRPDSIICTDLDTDEDTRNKDTIDKRFDWVEKALYATRSVSKPLLFLVLGNIIAPDCCVVRAAKKADKWDVVNIRDKDGNSTWPAKNSEEQIDRVLSKISTKAAQGEYFNNPISEGDIFKELTWGKCPPIASLPFVVNYADPSPSNKDKQKKGVSFKSQWLIGYKDGKFYVYHGFLEQVNNSIFVEWFYDQRDYVGGRTMVYNYIENNTLQDPFFEQVFKPMFHQMAIKRGFINVTPDDRRKPDKAVRIEGTLEPLVRNGQLVFNASEKGNPHMQRLAEQFKLFNMQMKAPADGPDSIEGGVAIINEKISALSTGSVKSWGKPTNRKRI
jgi:hypothetical protein